MDDDGIQYYNDYCCRSKLSDVATNPEEQMHSPLSYLDGGGMEDFGGHGGFLVAIEDFWGTRQRRQCRQRCTKWQGSTK